MSEKDRKVIQLRLCRKHFNGLETFNDDRPGITGSPRAAFRNSNVEVVHEGIQGPSRVLVALFQLKLE